MTARHLVVSAVNIVEGGTLTVVRNCLQAAREALGEEWTITALVHRQHLFDIAGIRYIEMPAIKRSWLARIRFEYFSCWSLSRELRPDFWLAMHDMTPAVQSPQAVYCHNAMCFYTLSLRELWHEPKLLLFSTFYSFFYRLHIHRNDAVIVQQSWMREAFKRRYGCRNVIVSHPVAATTARSDPARRRGSRFIYASLPRAFKNFETILQAWALLIATSEWDGELVVTIDGSENRYARSIFRRYRHLRGVRFVGRLSAVEMATSYAEADCLVFPSALETWGLPITEAMAVGLTILAADLPYAREAVGAYDAARFFPVRDPEALARLMHAYRHGQMTFTSGVQPIITEPFAPDWKSLLNLLLKPRTEPDLRN